MILPPYLQMGDVIALVSPARKVTVEEMLPFKRLCAHLGYICMEAPGLYEQAGQLAGEDYQRAEQINWAINEDKVRAIWCARGGYGVTRILSTIDWQRLIEKPKWLLGFSDATLLLNAFFNLGIACIHAPMAIQAEDKVSQEDWNAAFALLSGAPLSYTVDPHHLNRPGRAEGILAGGNLSLLAHSTGTVWMPKPQGTLLFLEDVDEYLYHIDRMLWQLRHSGYLSLISGVLVGEFSQMKDNTVPFGKDAYEILYDHFKEYSYPVVFNFPSGHGFRNIPLIFGSKMKATVSASEVNLVFD